MKTVIALFVFSIVVLAGAGASAVVDIEGRYWLTDLNASAKVSSGGVIGTDIDLADDLGVDDKENFLDARITLELGSHKIRYGFAPFKWNGSKALISSVTFNGQTYSASADTGTEIKLDYHRLAYEYDFIDTLDNRLGLVFEVKYFSGDARLTSSALGLDEIKTLRAPIPTIGVSGQVGLPFLFSVGGEVTGITLGKRAYLYDAEAGFNLKPAPFVVISGGYRIFKLHLEDSDNKGDLSIKGPYVMLKADF
ncbi:MAG: hypothetical protein AAB307_00815 [Deltaproteobacteria bacterium]